MPGLIGKYLGIKMTGFYTIVMWILMLLTGVVFVYTPGDLIVGDILGLDSSADSILIWVAYALIFIYYLIATLFPIDKIIGRIYPVFGAILIISAIGVFIGVIMDGGANLQNLSMATLPNHPGGQKFIPVFFVTVACGILSGFHGSQSTLISRTVTHEKEVRSTFYMMMIVEGLIAMCWAAGAMILFNRGTSIDTDPTQMVGIISRDFLGRIGGILAIIGVIVLPITSGDTAFRSVRLMIAEKFNIDQKNKWNRIKITVLIFIPAIAILIFAKSNSGGFNLLWRYFGFTNQFVATFALAMASVYLIVHSKANSMRFLLTAIPGLFYVFIVISYIFHAPIGIGIEKRLSGIVGISPDSYAVSYVIGIVAALLYAAYIIHLGKEKSKTM